MRKQIRTITLTKKERKKLRQRIRQTKDRKTADRLRVIWFKSKGYTHAEIADLLQMSINVITQCLQAYLAEGLDAVCRTNYKGKEPRLTVEQQAMLKVELKTRIYNTAAQVIAWVEEQLGVIYSIRGMQALLKRLGFTYKKNRLVPSKADPEAQRQFVQWFEKVRAELGPEDRIYFGDAVHVKHNAEAGYAWSPAGEPHSIPTNSGRERYNVLGAYCTQTFDDIAAGLVLSRAEGPRRRVEGQSTDVAGREFRIAARHTNVQDGTLALHQWLDDIFLHPSHQEQPDDHDQEYDPGGHVVGCCKHSVPSFFASHLFSWTGGTPQSARESDVW